MNRDEKIALIMQSRRNWKKIDFVEAYEDEWSEVPETPEECYEKMEEHIHNTYDDALLDEIIEDESL